jgi:acetyl esterase/lipase
MKNSNTSSNLFVRSSVSLLYAVILFALLCLPARGDGGVQVERDIPYSVVAGRIDPLQALDVYYPRDGKDLPVFFFVHGGGWKKGDKSLHADLGHALAGKGIVTVLVNHRLSPQVVHPAHARDVAAAFAWTYKNASKYGGDPGKIFVGGHSSGAHLTSLLLLDPTYLKEQGQNPSDVYGAVFIGGVYFLGSGNPSLSLPPGSPVITQMINPAFGSAPEALRKASPVFHARPMETPVLLLHAQNDNKALILQEKAFAEALRRKGTPVKTGVVPGRNHYTTMIAKPGKDVVTPLITPFIFFRSYD